MIVAGTHQHPAGPDGLIVGLHPQEEPAATDVDRDVSLRHARLWIDDGKLFIEDLESTNGTSILHSSSGGLSLVAPPRSVRNIVVTQPVELHYGDIICLGSTTRYIVLPEVLPGVDLR